MSAWLLLVADVHAAAWVLAADRPKELRRALGAAKAADITNAVAYDDLTVCVEVDDPRLRVRNRIERRLRGPIEVRSDCDWGWFPKGSGWVAVLVERPADTLLPTLQSLGWPYYDLQAASDGPLRLCVSEVVAGPPETLEAALEASTLQVRGVRRVGSCRR